MIRSPESVGGQGEASLWRRMHWMWRLAVMSVPQLLVGVAAFIPSMIDNREDWSPEDRVNANFALLVVVSLLLLASILLSGFSQREKQLLEKRVDLLDPNKSLRVIADGLFPRGAWRMTLLARTEAGLERRSAIAHNKHAAGAGVERIILRPDTSFYSLFSRNLSVGSRDNKHEEGSAWSDEFVVNVTPDPWEQWLDDLFGRSEDYVYASGGMKPRRIAWAAAKDDDTGETWCVLCESEDLNGIDTKFLAGREASAWILLWGRFQAASGRMHQSRSKGA